MIRTLYSAIFVTIATITYFFFNGINDRSLIGLIALNSFISLFMIFRIEEKPFTTNKIVNLFIYIFFIVANSSQYATRTNVLTFNHQFFINDFIVFQLIVLMILSCYNFVYFILTTQRETAPVHSTIQLRVKPKLIVYLSGAALCLVILHYASNPSLLFVRGLQESLNNSTEFETQSSGLIFRQFIRPIPICCLVIGLIAKCPRTVMRYLWIFALLALFPSALARNQAAMYWLPILILTMGKKLRRNVAMWLMMFALFVLFPFFNLFRRFSGNLDFEWSMDFFNEIDFDASQIFMAVIDQDFQTNWEQILGPLFFYVPRSMWPDKPVGSGHEFVTQNHGWFSNVSMPFFGEGYVNGGWIGLIIFTVILALLCARLDRIYWRKWFRANSFNQGYYLFFLGALIFIMRGDLMSSTAYTMGIIACYSVCLFITTNTKFFKLKL